jgi:peptidoglycan hydrolase-like protein with peptidoglycan-binding domain
MRKKSMLIVIFVLLFLCITTQAQTDTSNTETKTRKPVFRATRDQITQAQKILKVGESGKMDADTRAAVRKYQSENGLKPTGTLNRATLEKIGIALCHVKFLLISRPTAEFTGCENGKRQHKI